MKKYKSDIQSSFKPSRKFRKEKERSQCLFGSEEWTEALGRVSIAQSMIAAPLALLKRKVQTKA